MKIDRMKILHLITRMDRGGSAVNTLISATEQCRMGHDVTLAYGPSIESDMSAAERSKVEQDLHYFEATGGHIHILACMLRSLGRHDWHAYHEIQQLLHQGFDIVHTHTSKAGALGRLAALNTGMPIIHTAHGHIFHGYFGKLKTGLFITIERFLAKKTDALIALTHAEREDHLALHIGRAEQWHVIPSGVDIEHIHQSITTQKDHDAAGAPQWDVVSVGRLVPIKGMERLIAAWAVVCQQKKDARLALVGDGEEREALQALAKKHGIEAQVYFAGWADPLPYLAHARCFALLSHNEGMGRAVVEAFAAGLPCVVSDVCGLRELVDASVGQVVHADDPDAVAQALLTQWPENIADMTYARARRYSIESMIQGLETVYQQSRL